MKIRTYLILLCLLLLAACSGSGSAESSPMPTVRLTTTPQTSILDDFESAVTAWQAGLPPNYPDSSALSAGLNDQHPTSGVQSLSLTFSHDDKPKAIFFIERPTNLSGKRYITFDLYNDGSLEAVGLSLSTGTDWIWHESVPVPLEAGPNTLSFDLQANDYTTATTDWQPGTRIADLNDTRRLAVILYPTGEGTSFLDSVRLSDYLEGKSPQISSLLTPILKSTQPASSLNLVTMTNQPQVFQRLELAVETDGVYNNPFDPDEVNLRVHFTNELGEEILVPAFWYQDYDPASMEKTGEPGWRVRFTPTTAGQWSAQAELIGSGMTSPKLPLTVSPAEPGSDNVFTKLGFIHRHPTNPGFLAYDDGSTYFPIGINMGWGSSQPLPDYQRWLDALSANGGNVIRVWMASWSFGIEWNDTPLGDYAKRQDRAFLLDKVFEMAEERGVAIELVLLNHGANSATVNPQWHENPYNLDNGGMCATPECFVTDPKAKELFKRRLRYIAARWGYSPALLAWEWWNEADWTPIQDSQMAAWIKEMTPVLLEFDPNRHLVSTSYAQSSRPAISSLPEIDFTQLHLYDSTDPALGFADLHTRYGTEVPGKPVIFAEFGASAGGENTDNLDQQGLHLHNGLWASVFSGYASSAWYWWWDSYVDPLDLWRVFGRLSRFLEGEDLASLSPGKFRPSNANVPVLVLQNGEHALVWVHDRLYERGALERAQLETSLSGATPDPKWSYLPQPVEGLSLTILGLADGNYLARWYSPTTGEWKESVGFSVADGEAELEVPVFQGDIAVKIDNVP